MGLKSLLLCSDEKIVRVLRRVLGDLDIAVELCVDADSALRKLTRQRFEAIIVDVTDDGASDVLRSSCGCDRRTDYGAQGRVRHWCAFRNVQTGVQ